MYVNSIVCFFCGAVHPFKPCYICNKCGGTLDLTYDYNKAFEIDPFTKLSIFDKNIWRFKSLLPVLSHIKPITMGEGGTPFFQADAIGKVFKHKNIYIKNETINPTLSFKDRPVSVGVTIAKQFEFEGIVTASTGNNGVSTAAYASRASLPCRIFVPKGTPKEKLSLMLAYGAKLTEVDGTFSDAYIFAERESKQNNFFNLTSTYLNPFALEGDKTLAYEIYLQYGGVPDWIVIPIGAGPLLFGCFKGFKELKLSGKISSLPKMVGVQAQNCAPIVHAFDEGVVDVKPWKVKPDTIASGIADPLTSYPKDGARTLKTIRESLGLAISVDDKSIIEGIKLLALLEGILAEPAAATSISATKLLLSKCKIKTEESIVCVVTGHGIKDMSNLYL